MNATLWAVQALLGALFVFHARLLLAPPPRERLQPGMRYVLEMPAGLRAVAGVAEGLAGLGLLLPAVTGIAPGLTVLAAAGLAALMVGAIVYHLPRGEYPNTAFNLVLLALSAFVAYGRGFVAPL